MPIDIEALMRWAVREEWPKAPRPAAPAGVSPAWGAVSRQAAIMTEMVSDGAPAARLNAFGVVPLSAAWCAALPHPDAVVLHGLARELDGLDLTVPDEWDLLADMPEAGALGAAAIARVRDRVFPVLPNGARGRPRLFDLVVRGAVLGPPDVEGEPVKRDWARREDGRPAWFVKGWVAMDGADGPTGYEVELDGWNHARRVPLPGAYRKEVLMPDPEPLIRARMDYALWHIALTWLAAEAAEALPGRGVTGPARSPVPWEGEAPRPGRVLRVPGWVGMVPEARGRRRRVARAVA